MAGMALDVVALASVITTGVVGLAGLGATVWTSKRAREHAEKLATGQRQQERLQDAYLALLQAMRRSGLWAQNVKPTLDTDPPRPVPDPADDDDWSRVLALLDAYGSPEVRELHAKWLSVINEVGRAAWDIEFRRVHKEQLPRRLDGETQFDVYERLDKELRPAEREARQAVADQVAVELRAR